ncbi:MAG: cupredoxin domain-containing protein [bacterium]
MKRLSTAILFLIGSLAVAGCSRGTPGGQPPGQPPAVQMVEVIMREWAFEPSPLVAKTGKVTFRIKNDGSVEHNFLVENKPGAEVDAIKPGESKTLTADLTPGQYTVFCNLPGHREAGMVRTLKIE